MRTPFLFLFITRSEATKIGIVGQWKFWSRKHPYLEWAQKDPVIRLTANDGLRNVEVGKNAKI